MPTLMRSSASIQLVYAFSYTTNNYFVYDESGNNNHIILIS